MCCKTYNTHASYIGLHGCQRVLVNLSWFQPATHISTVHIAPKSLEIYQYNLRMKFSALNVDFNSISFDPLRSRSPPYGRGKISRRVIIRRCTLIPETAGLSRVSRTLAQISCTFCTTFMRSLTLKSWAMFIWVTGTTKTFLQFFITQSHPVVKMRARWRHFCCKICKIHFATFLFYT